MMPSTMPTRIVAAGGNLLLAAMTRSRCRRKAGLRIDTRVPVSPRPWDLGAMAPPACAPRAQAVVSGAIDTGGHDDHELRPDRGAIQTLQADALAQPHRVPHADGDDRRGLGAARAGRGLRRGLLHAPHAPPRDL